MTWDPLEAWPDERRWIWASLAFWLLLLRGPSFVDGLQTTPKLIPDFFQEYASAGTGRRAFRFMPAFTGPSHATLGGISAKNIRLFM